MATAACADRLDLVDAAFARQGGPEAHALREDYCPRCPIAPDCLVTGMAGEHGIWGGTSSNMRAAHGAPPIKQNANLKEVHR